MRATCLLGLTLITTKARCLLLPAGGAAAGLPAGGAGAGRPARAGECQFVLFVSLCFLWNACALTAVLAGTAGTGRPVHAGACQLNTAICTGFLLLLFHTSDCAELPAPGLSRDDSMQGWGLNRCMCTSHFLLVQKAAAIDPHNVAAQPGPEGEAAAQVGGCTAKYCARKVVGSRGFEQARRKPHRNGTASSLAVERRSILEKLHLPPMPATLYPPNFLTVLQRRDEVCYSHTMAVLRLLIDRTGVPGFAPSCFL